MFKQDQNDYTSFLLSALLNKGTLLWLQVGHYDADVIMDTNCRFSRFMKSLTNTYTSARVLFKESDERYNINISNRNAHGLFTYKNNEWMNDESVTIHKHISSHFYDTRFRIAEQETTATDVHRTALIELSNNTKKSVLLFWDITDTENMELTKNTLILEILKSKQKKHINIERLITCVPLIVSKLGLSYDYCNCIDNTSLFDMSFGNIFPFDIDKTQLIFSVNIDTTDTSNNELLPNIEHSLFFDELFSNNTTTNKMIEFLFKETSHSLKKSNISDLTNNPYMITYVDTSRMKMIHNLCIHLKSIHQSWQYNSTFIHLLSRIQKEVLNKYRLQLLQTVEPVVNFNIDKNQFLTINNIHSLDYSNCVLIQKMIKLFTHTNTKTVFGLLSDFFNVQETFQHNQKEYYYICTKPFIDTFIHQCNFLTMNDGITRNILI